MNTINIKIPVWKSKSFGIADFRLKGTGEIYVKCDYRDKNNNLLFPHTYVISKDKARKYKSIKCGGYMGREIPVADFDVLENE